jgi:hypothetical protein
MFPEGGQLPKMVHHMLTSTFLRLVGVVVVTALMVLPDRGVTTATITTTIQDLDTPMACEWEWTIRLLAPSAPNALLPRRLYLASCAATTSTTAAAASGGTNTTTTTRKMYTSYTVGPDRNQTQGVITVSVLVDESRSLRVEQSYSFPECRSMHGIAAHQDCSIVAALCLVSSPVPSLDFDYDPVASHFDVDKLTAAHNGYCDRKGHRPNRQMWLYEWPDGDLSRPPIKVIVHKSMGAGSFDYGQNYLRYGENDDTYGIALKVTTPNCEHESDSFMILNRASWTFQTQRQRGWTWLCATGHTIHNRPAYDAVSNKYAVLCSTDWNEQEEEKMGCEVAFRYEDRPRTIVHYVPRYGPLWIKGGAGPLVARPQGGFLGIIVGEPPTKQQRRRRRHNNGYYDDTTPVQLGLLQVTADGVVRPIQWNIVASDKPFFYLSWPQLAWLGEGDRYLLGWGRGYQSCAKYDNDDRDISLRHPWTYFVMEINSNGDILVPASEVSNTGGWGEVNEMVSLGPGRVGWSYVPLSRRQSASSSYLEAAPACNQTQLAHYVYTSPAVHSAEETVSSSSEATTTTSLVTEQEATAEDAASGYERTTLDCSLDSWPPGSHSSRSHHHGLFQYLLTIGCMAHVILTLIDSYH